MSLIVQKFGGTSVADTYHLMSVAKKAIAFYEKGNDVIVVVSAQGNTTDELIKKAKKISPYAKGREMDALMATGEQISASLLAMTIESMGVPAISLTGWQAGFETSSVFNDARILEINTERIKKEISEKKIVVITGFQGINSSGDITTLGRGGSDTSAVAIAGAMKADVCKIYTDVDGVYTADPRVVSSARKLEMLSYEEMFKLAALGAQVLNDTSIETAQKYDVEVEVLSSMKKDCKGTIVKNIPKNEINTVSGIADQKELAKVIISSLSSGARKESIISFLEEKGLIKDSALMPTGKNSEGLLVFLAKEENLPEVIKLLGSYLKEIAEEKADIFYEKDKAEISVVNLSDGLNVNIASIVFETLHENNVNIEMAMCDNSRISVVVDVENLHRSVNALHNKLFEEDYLT